MQKGTRGGTVLFRHVDTGVDICTCIMTVPAKPNVISMGPVDGVYIDYDVKSVIYELAYPVGMSGVPHCQSTPIVLIKEVP